MSQKSNPLVNFFMNTLSYMHKYYIVFVLFMIGFALVSYFYIRQTNSNLGYIASQLVGNQYQKPVNKVAEGIMTHQILANRYRLGNESIKGEIITHQANVDDSLRRLEILDKALQAKLFIDSHEQYPKNREFLHPNEISRKWENIKKTALEVPVNNLDSMHGEVIVDLRAWLEYLGYAYSNRLDPNLSGLPAIENTLIRLYDGRDLLIQIAILGETILSKKAINEDQLFQMQLLTAFLRKNITSMKSEVTRANFAKAAFLSNEGQKQSVDDSFKSYFASVEKFLTDNEIMLFNAKELNFSLPEYISDGKKALHSSFAFWDEVSDYREALLKNRKEEIEQTEYKVLAISLAIVLVGFLLGAFYIHGVITSIQNLDEVARRLTSGDLTARVDVKYEDEMGRASLIFNQMAESFEKMITQLRNLLNAIKRLSAGDFSARLVIENDSQTDDITQVSISFNNMAQSFEEIISQLHQLGINLTTSATEISAASKQQETIIIEQEATTREISVTANEISTTAREFATTVSDISRVAEHTSNLAATGKDNLGHMEGIMRQMVDASGNIASKLAVLNEKAGNITGVITTITKVADQTNLLSLNAAIEAEKAGEYGRSFAVIAREIRRLADQTALATLDIEKIVNEIMSAVSTSVMGVDDFTQEIRNGVSHVSKVGEQLTTIMEQVQVLTQRFETVNQGMQTQSAAAEQINEAMTQLSQTARLTTESIHQFHTTIQQLNASATDLRVAASRIKK